MKISPYGVVVLCICAGLGFSTMENLGYVIFDDANVGVFVAWMRALLDISLHTVTAGEIFSVIFPSPLDFNLKDFISIDRSASCLGRHRTVFFF